MNHVCDTILHLQPACPAPMKDKSWAKTAKRKSPTKMPNEVRKLAAAAHPGDQASRLRTLAVLPLPLAVAQIEHSASAMHPNIETKETIRSDQMIGPTST